MPIYGQIPPGLVEALMAAGQVPPGGVPVPGGPAPAAGFSMPEPRAVYDPGATTAPPGFGQRFLDMLASQLAGAQIVPGARTGSLGRLGANLFNLAVPSLAGARLAGRADQEALNANSQRAAAFRNAQAIQAEKERLAAVSQAARDLRLRRYKMEEQAKNPEALVPSPPELSQLGYPSQLPISTADAAMRMLFPERYRAPQNQYGVQPDQVEALAKGIIDGTVPPESLGNRWTGPVYARVKQLDPAFDQTQYRVNYDALKRHYASLNSGIQVRLQQSIENARVTTDAVEESMMRLQRIAPRSKYTSVNKLYNVLAKQGFANDPQVREVQNLISRVRALRFELANVYMGGGVPTDQAQKQASDIINEDMSPARLAGAVESARREINIRRQAINSAGTVSPLNPASAGVSTGTNLGPRVLPITPESSLTPRVVQVVRDASGRLVRVGGQ